MKTNLIIFIIFFVLIVKFNDEVDKNFALIIPF